jgi:hypothetical protein
MAEPTPPGLSTFLVEHYWPGVTPDEFEEAAERVRAAAEAMESEGRKVRYLHSTFVPDDESAFCVFAAEARADVGEAYARAGVAFERLLPAVEMRGEQR